ncbi:MAG: thiolase family protein [Gammaproteobacteria bacterium]
MTARRAVIVDIVRSPFARGRDDGALASLHPVDLYAFVLEGLLARTGIDPELVEDVISGCVLQVAEQAGNIGRQALLAAGMPESVPAVTLDRKCGSAQQAIDFAAQGIIAGAYDVVIAGGVEMMSLVPMKVNRMGKDDKGPKFHARYPDGLISQGVSAELIASRWQISREALDAFSVRSHHLAAAAREDSAGDIIPIRVETENGTQVVAADEGIRETSNVEKLSTLKTVFKNDEMTERFPEINWSITAGSSSQISDGAVASLVMEEKTAERLGLAPRAAVTHFAVSGDDPIMMLTGIIPATRKLLGKVDVSLNDIDAYEVNEAFASVPLAWQKELDTDPDKLNKLGGAIAIGHPVGASGGRLMANLIRTLENNNGRYGLQTMCEGGGMANATLIERL